MQPHVMRAERTPSFFPLWTARVTGTALCFVVTEEEWRTELRCDGLIVPLQVHMLKC